MDLLSRVKLESSSDKISYKDKLIFFGSCFSGNIGTKFQERLFHTSINPFGVIFNPISIFNLLERSIEKNYFTKEDWIFSNGKWINLDLHGKFSFSDIDVAIANSNSLIDMTNESLKSATYLFLTFGTSWVYEYLDNNKLVANCHKIPQKQFKKYLLSPETIVSKADEVLTKLKEFNPNLNLVFTVSPVRHWGDGARNNNISKGVLHLAINEIQKNIPSAYFPSYEIVMDELRDYRFFDSDMMHPNNLAIDYVWDKMIAHYFEQDTKKYISEIEKLLSASFHRPFDINSSEYQKFLNNQLNKIDEFKCKLPNIDFEALEITFKSKLL